MLPNHFYYFRKSIQPKYSYTPTGDLAINQLLRNKPHWRQAVPTSIKERKTLILADWTAGNWAREKRYSVKEKLFELIDAGFSIYAWQSGQIEEITKENLTQLLDEPQFIERLTSPAAPKEIEAVSIKQLPNAAKDSILILDDYQVQGLFHPEVFANPRELDVAELVKYRHKKEDLIPILNKMKPRISGFNDTKVSDESYTILEQLQKEFPEVAIKYQFKSVRLTDDEICSLLAQGQTQIARRTFSIEQLAKLEGITLHNVSIENLQKILPYLNSVKKIILLGCHFSSDIETRCSFPYLEKIKLVYSKISSTTLGDLIKDAPVLKTLDIVRSTVSDKDALPNISSQCFDTIKLRKGTFSKRNFQDILLQAKVRKIIFENCSILSDSITEIQHADLSSIKILEINDCSCDATYLNQMFVVLSQLEELRIHGGSIERFTNSFVLKSLKILEIDLDRFNDLASAFDDIQIEKLILKGDLTSAVPKLDKLNLASMEYFSLDNQEVCLQFLEETLNKAGNLKYLGLHGCSNLSKITNKLFLRNVHTLDLSGTDISAQSLEMILGQASNLVRLDLSGCDHLVLTPKLRELMQRVQVYYPDHIKLERKKPDYRQVGTDQTLSMNDLLKLSEDIKPYLDDSKGNLSRPNVPDCLFADEPLADEPLADGPLTDEPLTDEPLTDEPLTDEPLTDGPLTDGPLTDEPQAGEHETDEWPADATPEEKDAFVDAHTGFDNAQSLVKVTFFPVFRDQPSPAVTQYREKVFNDFEIESESCSIDQAFKLKHKGNLLIEACDAQACNQDVFSETAKLERSAVHEYYYGKTTLQVTQSWQPLPSLSAQEKLTHYHIAPDHQVEIAYSLRDNQYYIRGKQGKAPSEIAIDYLLKVPNPANTLPVEVQDIMDEFLGSKTKSGFNAGELLVDTENPTGMDYLNAILSQKKGACRHRAIAFDHLMKKHLPSIPVRTVANSIHMQSEVCIDGEWISCNLGGYPTTLELDNSHDPREKDALLSIGQGKDLLKENAYIAQFLQTWKHSKQPQLALKTYCEHLTQPKQAKKYLIEANNAESLQALALGIKAHCKEKNRPLFYIQKPDHLSCSAPFVTNQNNIGIINQGPGGPLHAFLTQDYPIGNPPVLLINAEQFDNDDLVQHNSLFDDNPKADGISLPPSTIIILLINTNKPDFNLGEDLTSRMDLVEECPVPEATLNLVYPPVEPKLAEEAEADINKVELFNSDQWENLLLGQWSINGNDLYFEEGLLHAALRKNSVLTLSNGLWEDASFQHFWKDALQNGFIDYEGQHIVLPQDFELRRKEGYHWAQLARHIRFEAGLTDGAEYLNPGLLSRYFSQYECVEKTRSMKKLSGLIQAATGKELSVNLTRELNRDEWARLLNECDKYHVNLVCHCAPGVRLPKVLQKQYRPEGQQKTNEFSATECSPCMIIKSTDRDTTLAQLRPKLVKSVFIDVSELETYDLMEQAHGHYDNEARKFEFTRVEKVLIKALDENEHVILTGKFSDSLLDHLMPILDRRATTSAHQSTLALIVDEDCSYKFPSIITHVVTVDEKVNELTKAYHPEFTKRLTPKQLEEEGLSKLKARLRYFKKHPQDEDSCKTWDGLKALSSEITLPPFNLADSKEKAHNYVKELIKDIRASLVESPTLYLSGLTGVGKTTFVERHLSKEPDIAIHFGEEQLKAWAEDKSDKIKVLFIDEANITPRQWSEFEGLFVEPPSVIIDGQLYSLDKSHKVIFAGNPLNYGNERQLAPLFERHGNAKVFAPMSGEFIYEMILKPLFANTKLQAHSQEISQRVLMLYRYLVNLSTNEVLISARELQLIVLLILAYYHRDDNEDLRDITAHYMYQIGSTMVPYEHKQDFDAMFKPDMPLYPRQFEAFKLKKSDYLITPSRQEIYQLIFDLLALRDYKKLNGHNDAQKFGGIGGMILEGDPGIGKSELLKAILNEFSFQEGTLDHEPIGDDIFYQIPIGMRNEQKKTIMLRGLAQAATLIVDEINSAPVMERWLNDLLMNKNPITKEYPDKPGVLVLGTQNPPTMAGRHKPSNAVKRRVLHIDLPAYPHKEMVTILVNEGCTHSVALRLVNIYVEMQSYARQNHFSPEPTFRDLLRLARISVRSGHMDALNSFYLSVDKPSLRQALLRAENRFNSNTVKSLAKYLTPGTIHIFDLHIRLFEHLILKELSEEKIQSLLKFLTVIVPETGEIEDDKIAFFNLFYDSKLEHFAAFDEVNEIFIRKPSLVKDLISMAKALDCYELLRLLLEAGNLSDLIYHLIATRNTELLTFFLEHSTQCFECLNDYTLNHNADVDIQLQLIQLHRFLSEHALEDKQIWYPILQDASPWTLNIMFQWLNRYQENHKREFLNLFYSKAHVLRLQGMTEETLFACVDKLLNHSESLFDFKQPLKFNRERIKFIHYLERKIFVARDSAVYSLWTEQKNSALLNEIYSGYSRLMAVPNQSKDVLLVISKELSAVPEGKESYSLKHELTSELRDITQKYLHSFWIRSQRRNSAKILLDRFDMNRLNYSTLLNDIHNARKEVFTNDTEKERHMHRYGSSRYYETLNQLEETLLNYWSKDPNAVSSFKSYLVHYKTTLQHSKQCLENALKHERETSSRHYDKHTPLEELPGYIRALKKEVLQRDESYQKYRDLVRNSDDLRLKKPG